MNELPVFVSVLAKVVAIALVILGLYELFFRKSAQEQTLKIYVDSGVIHDVENLPPGFNYTVIYLDEMEDDMENEDDEQD